MIIPFLAPYLALLETAVIFYPVILVLAFISLIAIPGDIQSKGMEEWPGSPTLSVFCNVLIFALVIYHFGIDVSSWKVWIPALVIYLIIGVGWSTVKWVIFCRRAGAALKDVIAKYVPSEGFDEKMGTLAFMKYVFASDEIRAYGDKPYIGSNTEGIKLMTREQVIGLYVPQVTAHKGQVLIWIICWPLSIIKWALADMLRDLCNALFSAIRGWFQKIAKSAFSGI